MNFGDNERAMGEIDTGQFAEILGVSSIEIPEETRRLLHTFDRTYRDVTAEERDDQILAVLKRVNDERLLRTTVENQEAFERGWSENLADCRRDGVSLKTLRPKYVKPLPMIRFRGKYIVPTNPYLFDDLCTVSLNYLFHRYLAQSDSVYEFGCGTGRYLFMLGGIYPQKNLIGLDWTEASQGILDLVAQQTGLSIVGQRFDMFDPKDLTLAPNSAVLTVGALEQLGDRHGPLLQYFLANRPGLVIHHEPILEMYREDSLFDYLAILYHKRRNYLNGYLTELRNLAGQGKVEIIFERCQAYGDLFNDGSGIVIWRPR